MLWNLRESLFSGGLNSKSSVPDYVRCQSCLNLGLGLGLGLTYVMWDQIPNHALAYSVPILCLLCAYSVPTLFCRLWSYPQVSRHYRINNR